MPKEKYDPHDQNYVDDEGRRKLLIIAGIVLAVPPAVAATYEIITRVAPDAIHSFQPKEKTATPEQWFDKPTQTETPRVENGIASYILPAKTLGWEVFSSSDLSSPVVLHIDCETSGNDHTINTNLVKSNIGSNPTISVEIYKPTGSAIDSWHSLLLQKKKDLLAKFGNGRGIKVLVYVEKGTGYNPNIFDHNYSTIDSIS